MLGSRSSVTVSKRRKKIATCVTIPRDRGQRRENIHITTPIRFTADGAARISVRTIAEAGVIVVTARGRCGRPDVFTFGDLALGRHSAGAETRRPTRRTAEFGRGSVERRADRASAKAGTWSRSSAGQKAGNLGSGEQPTMTAYPNDNARRQRGATTIFLAVLLVALFGFSALVIDLGLALVTKTELQNTSDAGTLAGARELALVYKEKGQYTSYKDYTLSSSDKARIQSKMSSITQANTAAGETVSILASDVVYGTYDNSTGTIKAQEKGVKAVELKSRRDETINGELQLSTARVLGIPTLGVDATSAAALSPLGTVPAGYGEIPIGISSYWFDSHSCENDRTIKFYPTGSMDGCAGWHTFEEMPANASRLKTILNGLEAGTYSSPETTAGETYYNFTGGAVASRFPDMKSLYDAKKDANGDWLVTVPVYQQNSCSNPNGSTLIIGFAKARVYGIETAPSSTILAEVQCGIVEEGQGGGPNDYGTLYGLPGMVR
jgi:Flp pilus assembly protein TadG